MEATRIVQNLAYSYEAKMSNEECWRHQKLRDLPISKQRRVLSSDFRQISWILELKLRLYLLCFKASKGQQQQEQQQQQRQRRRQQQLQQQKLAD